MSHDVMTVIAMSLLVLLCRYFPLTRYTVIGIDSQDQVQQYYMFYMHVAIMVSSQKVQVGAASCLAGCRGGDMSTYTLVCPHKPHFSVPPQTTFQSAPTNHILVCPYKPHSSVPSRTTF